MQAIISSIFIEIHIIKKQKTPFLYFSLKRFVNYQRISLKCLFNSFVYNEKAYMINIFYHVFNCVISISKIACYNLQNIKVLIFSIIYCGY